MGPPAPVKSDHVLDTVGMIMTARPYVVLQEKHPARLDRRRQRDANAVQGNCAPNERLVGSAKLSAQALDGLRKGILPQKPFHGRMQLFKIAQVHSLVLRGDIKSAVLAKDRKS